MQNSTAPTAVNLDKFHRTYRSKFQQIL
eukprot:SAG31_NODE_14836_length_785_cov_1.100583_1_plen_27_part_10